jgi:hypothetical protein
MRARDNRIRMVNFRTTATEYKALELAAAAAGFNTIAAYIRSKIQPEGVSQAEILRRLEAVEAAIARLAVEA